MHLWLYQNLLIDLLVLSVWKHIWRPMGNAWLHLSSFNIECPRWCIFLIFQFLKINSKLIRFLSILFFDVHKILVVTQKGCHVKFPELVDQSRNVWYSFILVTKIYILIINSPVRFIAFIQWFFWSNVQRILSCRWKIA